MRTTGCLLCCIGCLIVGLLTNSCVKEIDTDQLDEFVLEPAMELSLVYFDFLASDFDESDGPIPPYIDSTQADIFSEDFFNDHLMAAEFTITHTNTVERAFKAEILFKDAGGNVLLSVNVAIPAYNGTPQEVTTLIPFDEGQIGILKNTFTISAEITLLPGNPPLDDTSSGSIKFSSSAIFYLEFE